MNTKLHYKMYKAGKRWFFGAIMTASMGIGIITIDSNVEADANISINETSNLSNRQDNILISDSVVSESNQSAESSTATSEAVSESNQSAESSTATSEAVSESNQSAESSTATSEAVSESDQSAESSTVTSEAVSESDQSAESSTATSEAVSESNQSAESSTATSEAVSESDQSAESSTATSEAVSESNQSAESSTATSEVVSEDNQDPVSTTVVKQNNPTNSRNKSVSVSYQDFLKRVGVRANEITHVTKENFLDYFDLDGDATYDAETGVVTLVPDENDKVGNFTLKNKIDLNQSFQLVGQVNLGDDSDGADGIGMAFHNGNTSDIGISGGSNGMGNLEHAVGFKLDTWHNDAADPNPDATSASDQFGTSADPNTNGEPFGGFVTTTYKHPNDNDAYPEVWWPETAQNEGEDGYQVIGNDAVDGQYHDFTMNYDGTTHELVITYDTNSNVLTWRKTIDINNYDNNLAAFMMSASTGWAKNLHLFKITSFDYYGSEDALVHFIDGTTGKELETEEISGLPDELINYDASEKINNYINQGYELQNNELTPDTVYDNNELEDQEFNITLVHGQVTINAANPVVPGNPINTDDPNSPVYPSGTDFNSVSHNVSQTINYQFADGTTAAPAAKDAVTFNRDVVVDKVTGEILSTGDWQAVNDDTSFDEVSSPVVDGYYADTSKIDAVNDLTEDSQDSNQVVTYEPIGQVVISSPDDDFPNAGTITYPNNPNYATTVGSVTLPEVPGYTAFDADGNEMLPGTVITPTNPGENTNIIYRRDTGTVTVNYVDQDDNSLKDQTIINGNTGDNYETQSPVINGYYLTAQPGNATGVIDKAGTTVTYKYALVGSLVATSDDPDFPGVDAVPYPNDASDPTKVGTVTIPEVPGYTAYGVDGNKLDPGTVITPANRGENTNIHYVRDTGKVTVHYVDKAGNSIDNSVIIEGNTGDNYQSDSKVINGYVLDSVPENATGSITNDETDVTYVYEPVGALVPSSTDPNFPNIDNVVYPNDDNDPTQVGTVTVPEVPGYTAYDVDGSKLAPGTVITPADAAVNTPIIYQRDTGTMTVHYVDENGDELSDSDMTTGGTGDAYTSDAKVINGYVLKAIPANSTGKFENGNVDVNYIYEPVGHVIISSTDSDFPNPGDMTYENDPNDPSKVLSVTVPDVPGYIAIDHNGTVVAPGTVVAIDNPGEDTPLTYVKADGTVVTHYVDENGSEIENSTTTNGVLGDDYTTTAPVINGYVLVETPANSTGTVTTGQTDVTYTYAPVGALVATSDDPNFPAQTPVTYPNDDNDPTQVGTVTVPAVPGYTAVDSDGHELASGTVITPTNPTKDTTINYVPVAKTGQVVTHYVDATGNELAPSTTMTSNQGDDYTTTAPVINGYVLVETPANSTGTVTTGQTDVTYTYAPVGALVATSDDPNFPAQTPVTYPNDDSDPTQVGTVTVPAVSGYTAVDSDGHELAPGTVITPTDPTKDTTINYVPVTKTGQVVTHYVDATGNELAPSTTMTSNQGDNYTTTAPVINGYVLVETPANSTGTVTTDQTDVTYTYAPVGALVATSDDPNFPAQTPVTYPNDDSDPTQVGTVTVPAVPGYTAVDSDGHELAPGTAITPTDPTKDTTINYVPVTNTGQVVTHYVDATGNELAPSTTMTSNQGDDYTTTAPVINGYVLVETPANSTGTVTTGQTDVTYTYAPVGALVATSDDPNFPAQTPVTYPNDDNDPTQVGTVTVPAVPGYTAVDSDGHELASGTVITPTNPTKDTIINFILDKTIGQVTIHYVDQNGNTIAADDILTGYIGSMYTTQGKQIPGYILTKVPNTAKGQFATNNIDITYIYHLVQNTDQTNNDVTGVNDNQNTINNNVNVDDQGANINDISISNDAIDNKAHHSNINNKKALLPQTNVNDNQNKLMGVIVASLFVALSSLLSILGIYNKKGNKN